MDRREALKKMAVGGATVVGSTAVMTKTAFAYTAPSISVAPSITFAGDTDIVGDNGSKMRVKIAAGSAACPGSAKSTSATLVSLTAEVGARLRLPDGSDSNPSSNSNRRVLRPFYLPNWSYGTPQINHATGADAFQSFNLLNAGHDPDFTLRFTKCSLTNGGTLDHGDDTTRFRSGDRIQLRVTVTWRCTYSDNTTRDRSRTYTGVIRPPGSGDAAGWNGSSSWVIVSQLA